jgi:hypothetical protein
MAFFNSAVEVLQTPVIAIGAGRGIWGVIFFVPPWTRQPQNGKLPTR